MISLSDSEKDTLYTDSNGSFHLSLNEEQKILYAHVPGFTSDTIVLFPDSFPKTKRDTIVIFLHPVYTVKEISITGYQPLGVVIPSVPYLSENYPKSCFKSMGQAIYMRRVKP